MSFDDLALGAGPGKSLARYVNRPLPRVVGGFGPELFADALVELVATACDEPVGEDQPRGSRSGQRVARRDRGRERVPRGFRPRTRCLETLFSFACIANGDCEISAPSPLVACPRIT